MSGGIDVAAPVLLGIAAVFAILWARERDRRTLAEIDKRTMTWHRDYLQKISEIHKDDAEDLATKNVQIDRDLAAVRRDLAAVRDELAAANAHIASDGNTGLVIELGNALKTANDEVTRLQTKVVARAFKIPEASMPGEGRDR